MPTCSKCKQDIDPKHMKKDNRSPNGLASHCKSCHNKINKISYQRHKEKYKARYREYSKFRHLHFKDLIFNHYGAKCVCCGEDTIEFLTIDHVNDDGSEHRRHRGSNWYEDVIKEGYPNTYQILCWNCNVAKHRHGVCPHQM